MRIAGPEILLVERALKLYAETLRAREDRAILRGDDGRTFRADRERVVDLLDRITEEV
ncbi:MAG TPA: hypothetical protein VFT76_00125 [Actinomycetota bacterium]|nr:hypothetical protein [Actinomycetota bacterium]